LFFFSLPARSGGGVGGCAGFCFLFHHLLRATYGKVHKARFPATTVPPKVPVKMWLPRPPQVVAVLVARQVPNQSNLFQPTTHTNLARSNRLSQELPGSSDSHGHIRVLASRRGVESGDGSGDGLPWRPSSQPNPFRRATAATTTYPFKSVASDNPGSSDFENNAFFTPLFPAHFLHLSTQPQPQ